MADIGTTNSDADGIMDDVESTAAEEKAAAAEAAGVPAEPEIGISETKDAVRFLCRIANSAHKFKKVGFASAWALISDIGPSGVAAIAGADKIPAELGDLNANEVESLVEMVKQELDLEDDYAEQVAEEVVSIVGQIGKLVIKVSEGKKGVGTQTAKSA